MNQDLFAQVCDYLARDISAEAQKLQNSLYNQEQNLLAKLNKAREELLQIYRDHNHLSPLGFYNEEEDDINLKFQPGLQGWKTESGYRLSHDKRVECSRLRSELGVHRKFAAKQEHRIYGLREAAEIIQRAKYRGAQAFLERLEEERNQTK